MVDLLTSYIGCQTKSLRLELGLCARAYRAPSVWEDWSWWRILSAMPKPPRSDIAPASDSDANPESAPPLPEQPLSLSSPVNPSTSCNGFRSSAIRLASNWCAHRSSLGSFACAAPDALCEDKPCNPVPAVCTRAPPARLRALRPLSSPAV